MKKSYRCSQPSARSPLLTIAAAVAGLLAVPCWAQTNQGLTARSGEWLWPQLQARITLQTTALTLTSPARLGEATAARGVQGGALLGDYVFATPSLGNFRATSGVMLGGPGGAPVFFSAPSVRLGVTVFDNGLAASSASESAATVPYVGLGYSSASLWRSLSLSADVGLVAARPAGLGGFGRAVLGTQAMDAAVRDLRLAPVLQLGVRYSF